MKEVTEIRVNSDFFSLLFKENEGKNLGSSIKIVKLSKDDPRFGQISEMQKYIQKKYDTNFFFGWEIKRKYHKNEIEAAQLLHIKIKTTFEPAGEECGTTYDETTACEICGANRRKTGFLKLKRDSIPEKDIARTIAGEIIVSEEFKNAVKKWGLKGVIMKPVLFENGESNFYQLNASTEVELSPKTLAGINPFDLSTGSKGEIYKCPKGHTIGLNLLSEPYIVDESLNINLDFFASKQMTGVRRGLLRPESLYLCSQEFRKMVLEAKLHGFDFEIAYINGE